MEGSRAGAIGAAQGLRGWWPAWSARRHGGKQALRHSGDLPASRRQRPAPFHGVAGPGVEGGEAARIDELQVRAVANQQRLIRVRMFGERASRPFQQIDQPVIVKIKIVCRIAGVGRGVEIKLPRLFQGWEPWTGPAALRRRSKVFAGSRSFGMDRPGQKQRRRRLHSRHERENSETAPRQRLPKDRRGKPHRRRSPRCGSLEWPASLGLSRSRHRGVPAGLRGQESKTGL